MERARIILACLEGKEIQQVAGELDVSIPTVTKWRQRFSLWGWRGLRDQPRPGKPVTYDKEFRNRVLATLEGPPHWRRDSMPAFTPSGAFCAAKESTCRGGVVGA